MMSLGALHRSDRYLARLVLDLQSAGESFEFQGPHFITEVLKYTPDEYTDLSSLQVVLLEDIDFQEESPEEQERLRAQATPLDLPSFRALLVSLKQQLSRLEQDRFFRTRPQQHIQTIDDALQFLTQWGEQDVYLVVAHVDDYL